MRMPCSEAGDSSQNGDRVLGVYYRKADFCCAIFVGKTTQCKGYSYRNISWLRWKCVSRKAVHNWVRKFSRERSKVADDARPGRAVQIAKEATVQRVEELIRADRRITTNSVATALECFCGLA
jgi:transposase